ncbi:LADA_0C01970g1_1 [Lachancea dasiensis]|uniref:Mannosyltransferase n=1 Tax=Lachancea dasiensis TaxID=1072105 RepID=A0A1G4IXR9_9SACH|nr:LADA_0C01970g1_1 [Lachancea dasiensis]
MTAYSQSTHGPESRIKTSCKPFTYSHLSNKSILRALVLFRFANAFFVNSFFQPDEFWQSLEPAHVKAFGYGQLTWEWEYGLRSYAFPFVFELVYRAVSLLAKAMSHLVAIHVDVFVLGASKLVPDSTLAWSMAAEMRSFPQEIQRFVEYQGVIYGPKLLMAVFAGVGEFYAIKFTERIYNMCFGGKKSALDQRAQVRFSAMVLSSTNFFNCFMITRTFVNTFEMDLTSIAFYFWDWTNGEHVEGTAFTKSLLCGIFLCIQRPTNAFIWLPMGLCLSWTLLSKRKYALLAKLIAKVCLTLMATVFFTTAIDYYFYGELFLPAARFINFNYTSALSTFYGTAPWHFHILQSVPLIAGYSFPVLIYGFVSLRAESHKLFGLADPLQLIKAIIIVNIALYSLIGHKEFRFLYNLQPLFLVISSIATLKLFSFRDSRPHCQPQWYYWIIPFTSLLTALLLSCFHESGVIRVVKFLHHVPDLHSVGFVMPCHSTPGQSFIHRSDIHDIWAISCEPPLHLLSDPDAAIKLPSYMDESDYLYDNIPKFVYQNFPPVFRRSLRSPGKSYSHEWPEYLVIFQHLDEVFMDEFLQDTGYRKEVRYFNTLSHWDSKRAGDVVVYHKPPWI